jgi:hypothetical protein
MRTLVLLFALIALICSTPGGFTPVDTNDLPSLSNNDIYQAA